MRSKNRSSVVPTVNVNRGGIKKKRSSSALGILTGVIGNEREFEIIVRLEEQLASPLGVPGTRDHRLHAYCFRICLTKDSANRIPFVKPSD